MARASNPRSSGKPKSKGNVRRAVKVMPTSGKMGRGSMGHKPGPNC